ncbi:uncharacterized protein LOC124191494 [Daphnia pulex]|uniref:uncharacterized protein LOC124191494 n=1 Tax=Daphnia pulex TaxID=6669 RepID=UPI001EDFE491|nr:uncharacterized protein LOC124191494 [Daphnia pulex]
MRWHVATLAAVWLIIMGWCGSAVMGQPIAGSMDQPHPPHHPPAGQTIPEMWALMDPADGPPDTIRDGDDLNGDLYYFPAVPIMKRQQSLDDDSGWISQDRSKRQSQSHSGSSGNHHSQLSIISPIEALRSRLRLEMLRRQYGNQIKQNQDKLERVGKRRKRSNQSSPIAVDGSDEKRMSQPSVAPAAIKAP